MKVDRIDPYLVCVAPHGTIALATETVGVQFLIIKVKELYTKELNFAKQVSPECFLESRVLSMKWGPMLSSTNGGALLCLVLSDGSFAIVMDSVNHVNCVYKSQDVNLTATAWMGQSLLVANNLGEIFKVDLTKNFELSPFRTVNLPVVSMDASITHLAVVLSNNKCMCLVSQGNEFREVLPESDVVVVNLKVSLTNVFVQTITHVYVYDQSLKLVAKVELKCHFPGNLIDLGTAAFAVVHSNGLLSVYGNMDLDLSVNGGRVECVQRHPSLPYGVIVLGPDFKGWQYPSFSTRSVDIGIFPLQGLVNFQFALQSFPASFLACRVHAIQKPEFKSDIEVEFKSLKSMFVSPQFDRLRFDWLFGDKEGSIQKVYDYIYNFLNPTNSDLDRMVYDWLGNKQQQNEDDEFTLSGDLITETFKLSEYFSKQKTVKSISGHEWSRCALTGLPLLSVDTRVSEDLEFKSYKEPPKLVGPSGSPMVHELLSSAGFCVFTGSLWM